jgi:hypothetical protein
MVIVGIIVMIAVFITALIVYFTPSHPTQATAQTPVTVEATPTETPSAPTLAPVESLPSISIPPTVPAPQPAAVSLKDEVVNGEARMVFPKIGFNELLTPVEITYDQAGQPILPKDVKPYLATNLSSKNCDVSGGDIIMGHSSIYVDYWGAVPLNAFKTLSPRDIGQMFTIGTHRYEASSIIIQPKAHLVTTKEFWCQPTGNVSIVTCYTQDEDGDNVIVIGRPVA